MGEKERRIIDQILLDEPSDTRLFRINAGQGWVGDVRSTRGGISIRNPRVLHAAPEGWPDLCGWQSITITPDMVGQTVAVFVAVEAKTPGVPVSRGQRSFLATLRRMGARVSVVTEQSAEPDPPGKTRARRRPRR